MTPEPDSIRDVLCRAMCESGLTCRDLARRAGVDISRVAGVYRGGGRSLDTAEALARVLGLSLARVAPSNSPHINLVDDLAEGASGLILTAEEASDGPLPHSQVYVKGGSGSQRGEPAGIPARS